jgi:NAD-dependent dihydropyrimidine dehydrogenase PreA subunit
MTENAVSVDIEIIKENCTGCLCCQLICSYTYTGRFNPLRARLRVSVREGARIEFTDDCIKCGLCVEYCTYGALRISGEEA